MAIFSTLRSQRMTKKQTEAISQMIAFRLCQEWFALPILAIHKVIPLGKVYGDPQNRGISITTYEQQELLVIDVVKQIFNGAIYITQESPTEGFGEDNLLNENQQRYLLILQNKTTNLIGLPIDSPPSLYRVSSSAIKNLPETYLETGNIQCISSKIIELPNLPPLFVLDPQKLIASIKMEQVVPLKM